MSLRIKKGDTVVVLAGKDKGKSGKVLSVVIDDNKAIVEGLNIMKKHQKARSEQKPSGIIELAAPINMSNLALWCAACKKGVRFRTKINEDKSKVRICTKCENQL